MNLDELDNCPGIFIPCDNIKDLTLLLNALYDNKILTDESFKLIYCPKNIHDILNNPL